MGLTRLPPVVHWCEICDQYLNLPVDHDEQGRRMGECPYCGELIWDEPASLGWKGGERTHDVVRFRTDRNDP